MSKSIAVVQQTAAGQLQIDAVGVRLVAAVGAAVNVDHAEIALVDILCGEEKAMVVGPQRALKLAEIARHLDEPAIAVGS